MCSAMISICMLIVIVLQFEAVLGGVGLYCIGTQRTVKRSPVPRDSVKTTSVESNKLPTNAKDSWLRRIACLAQLPVDLDLDTVGGGIYTVSVAPNPPYVGQTGCVIEGNP